MQFLIKPISTINAEHKLSTTSSLFLTFIRKDLTSNERIIFERYPVVYHNLNHENYTSSNDATDIFDQRRPILTIQYDDIGNIANINEKKQWKQMNC